MISPCRRVAPEFQPPYRRASARPFEPRKRILPRGVTHNIVPLLPRRYRAVFSGRHFFSFTEPAAPAERGRTPLSSSSDETFTTAFRAEPKPFFAYSAVPCVTIRRNVRNIRNIYRYRSCDSKRARTKIFLRFSHYAFRVRTNDYVRRSETGVVWPYLKKNRTIRRAEILASLRRTIFRCVLTPPKQSCFTRKIGLRRQGARNVFIVIPLPPKKKKKNRKTPLV